MMIDSRPGAPAPVMATELIMVPSKEAETELLVEAMQRAGAGGRQLEILEAGCGKKWPFDLSNVSHRLTGIDLDAGALAMRVDGGDLDEAIHGDLRDANLVDGQFDVVYNSFVLEHIDGADVVLDNLVRWAKPGATILLRFPDRDSAFGFVTRMTPHWVHVLYKRWMMGDKNAGKPSHEPYRTYYDSVVSRKGFHQYCDSKGLVIVHERGFPVSEAGSGIAFKFAILATRALNILSLGKLPWRHMWLTYVVIKP